MDASCEELGETLDGDSRLAHVAFLTRSRTRRRCRASLNSSRVISRRGVKRIHAYAVACRRLLKRGWVVVRWIECTTRQKEVDSANASGGRGVRLAIWNAATVSTHHAYLHSQTTPDEPVNDAREEESVRRTYLCKCRCASPSLRYSALLRDGIGFVCALHFSSAVSRRFRYSWIKLFERCVLNPTFFLSGDSVFLQI